MKGKNFTVRNILLYSSLNSIWVVKGTLYYLAPGLMLTKPGEENKAKQKHQKEF